MSSKKLALARISDSENSDLEEEYEEARIKVERPENYYDKARNLYVPRDPKKRAQRMGEFANDVNREVFSKNSEQIHQKYGENSRAVKQLKGEERMDCIASSISHGGKKGVISGNVKERTGYSRSRKEYGTYGLDEGLHKPVVEKVISDKYPDMAKTTFDIIGPSKPATDHKENAQVHAETQQLAFGVDSSSTLGVSKPPCAKCEDTLGQHGFSDVGHPEGWRNDNPKNWEHPEDSNPIERQFTIPRKKVTYDADLSYRKAKVQNDALSAHVVRNITKAYKPKVNASIASTVESIVEDWDRSGGASAAGPNSSAGTYKGRIIKGAYARASTGDAEAHWSVCHARANGPAAGAGVHASLLGVGAYASAELARAEASAAGVTVGVGLNLNTGVSAGVDGVSASFLGFGASVGPSIAVRTPVADVSCVIS